MMWFFAVLIVLMIGGVVVVAMGGGEPMAEEYDDRPDVRVQADGPLTADDLRGLRFTTAVRGYRVSEVDALIRTLVAQLDTARDPADVPVPAPAPTEVPATDDLGFAPGADQAPAETPDAPDAPAPAEDRLPDWRAPGNTTSETATPGTATDEDAPHG